jgi:hypothetical protein
MTQAKQAAKGGPRRPRVRLNLEDFKEGDERPNIAVTLVDTDGKPLHIAEVDNQGNVEVPEAALKKAHRVLIGPSVRDDAPVDPETILRYRPVDLEKLIQAGVINLPRLVWEKWWLRLRCVTGTVRLCHRRPWWYHDLLRLATTATLEPTMRLQASAASLGGQRGAAAVLSQRATLSEFQPVAVSPSGSPASLAELLLFPFHCHVICNGTVEVYRRTCCCEPWIIHDPRLPELIRELEDLIIQVEPIPFPWPIPDPNPPDPPYVQQLFFKDGALDEKAVHATADLQAIRALKPVQVAEYINARPYLLCRRYSCSAPVKVAEGNINPDGRFTLCWLDWRRTIGSRCHEEYAYIVRQRFGPFAFIVYNGVAANIWFHAGDEANLVSYSPWAYACRNNGDPGSGAYVFLDLIGDTESWNLKTPNATGWDRVALPGFNDGLVFPASAAAALGANLNRNWGGTLKLNYKFSEDMRVAPVGAKYYRISVSEADNNGVPVGTRFALSAGLSWDKSEPDGLGGVNIVPVTLGPFSAGGQDNLYLIPYDAEADWNAGQYHGYLDTTDARWSDPTKRHLVTVEVFNAGGTRLRPTGTPASGAGGAEAAAPFTYRRRFQDLGPTAEVPFAALTHMFWWDNQALQASINWLNKDGLVFSEECLFLLGTAGSTFGVGYRAYHPNEMFQLSHGLSWQRGLGTAAGATGALLSGSPFNVGQPPAAPGNSPTNTFAQMLRTDLDPTRKKCAFTVFLGISSKTTDGDYLGNGSLTRSAAFALEIN